MKRLSRYLFIFEALLLAFPSILGLLLVVGSLAPVLTGVSGILRNPHLPDAGIGLVILLGLICAWRLALSFIFSGSLATRNLSLWWWVTASAFAVASVALVAYSRFTGSDPETSPWALFGYGALFVPSYLHLAAEVWLRAV